AERRIGDVAQHAAVHGPHRVRMSRGIDLELEDRAARFDLAQVEADRLRDRRTRNLAARLRLQDVEELHSRTTERITSPRFMSSKAATTSSNAITRVTIPARSSWPSSASRASRGKSS